jgi:maleate isomerase
MDNKLLNEVHVPIAGLHTDALGYRAKVGVVVPGTNTTVQPEYDAMRPPGVTNHVTRMLLPPRPYDDMERYSHALQTEEGTLIEALDLLLQCEPAVVAHGHSIHSFRGDVDMALGEQQRLSAHCKVPFWTPSVAILRGLQTLKLKRIAVLTPYWPPADAMIANWFRSAGFDVVGSDGLKATGPTNVARISLDAILAGFRLVDSDRAEALIHVGTALPVSSLTVRIEQIHGKPLIGVNVATYWAALRSVGINDRLKGFGVLVEEH